MSDESGGSDSGGGDSDSGSSGDYSGPNYSSPESSGLSLSSSYSVKDQYAAYGEGKDIADKATADLNQDKTSITDSAPPAEKTFGSSLYSYFDSLKGPANTVKNLAVLFGPTTPTAKVMAGYSLGNSLDFSSLNIGFDKDRKAWNGDSIGGGNISNYGGGSNDWLSIGASQGATVNKQTVALADSPDMYSGGVSVDEETKKSYDSATDSIVTTKTSSKYSLSDIIGLIAGAATIYGALK